MAQLSDQELREAAAEAGISPHELRHALAERQGTDLARPDEAHSLMGPPDRGTTATHVEGRVGQPPTQAIGSVRASIERQTGRSGHRQGELEADVVDDDLGLTYRLRTQDDGSGGALVRVDVDPTAGKSASTIAGVSIAAITTVVLGLGWLLGSTLLGLGGLGLGVLGGLKVFRRASALGRGIHSARAIAAHALMEAEDKAPPGGSPSALPPA
ncbi:MAG: hypothetical protein AAGF11_37735 [Myxococcota bacterium]